MRTHTEVALRSTEIRRNQTQREKNRGRIRNGKRWGESGSQTADSGKRRVKATPALLSVGFAPAGNKAHLWPLGGVSHLQKRSSKALVEGSHSR